MQNKNKSVISRRLWMQSSLAIAPVQTNNGVAISPVDQVEDAWPAR